MRLEPLVQRIDRASTNTPSADNQSRSPGTHFQDARVPLKEGLAHPDTVCVGPNEADLASHEVSLLGYGIDGANCTPSLRDIITSFNASNRVGHSNRGSNAIIRRHFGQKVCLIKGFQ